MNKTPPAQVTQRTTVLILGLFVVLSLLQIADFHSTLTAVNQSEVNGMLLWLAHWVPPTTALVCIKALDLVLLLSMWFVWNARRGEFDREWLTCLVVCVLAYFTVVANNFAGR